MKIQCSSKQTDGHTDIVTPWAPVGAKIDEIQADIYLLKIIKLLSFESQPSSFGPICLEDNNFSYVEND